MGTPFSAQEDAEAGGLMSCGLSLPAVFRRAAESAVDSVLQGAGPADLPIEQRTSHELVINPNTGKTLGVAARGSLVARAGAVIRQSSVAARESPACPGLASDVREKAGSAPLLPAPQVASSTAR